MKTELYTFLLNANAIHWIGNIKWPVTGSSQVYLMITSQHKYVILPIMCIHDYTPIHKTDNITHRCIYSNYKPIHL